MQSQCLYDEGEEAWPLKLHLGAGSVFLKGYTNIDIRGVLADDYPQAMLDNETTIDNYYRGLEGTMKSLPHPRSTVVNSLADIRQLPYGARAVDKVVAIQVFEHLTPVEAIKTLDHWHALLKSGAPLVLSVPDMLGTMFLLESDDEQERSFAVRHLRGSYKNEYARHYAWYTETTLTQLLEHCGFQVERLPNFHLYPSILLRGKSL